MAPKTQIICANCQAKLNYDPERIKFKVVKVKCPGCGASLRLTKPDACKEPPLTPTAVRPPAPMASGSPDAPRSEESSISTSENPEGNKTLPGVEQGPLIPEEKLVAQAVPRESLLEDYTRDKLMAYEDGEVEELDIEWSIYADKKKLKIPEAGPGPDMHLAVAEEYQDLLADLNQSEMYNLLGETNLGKNRLDQAVRDFSYALEINPDYADALVNRGSAYTLLSKYNEALKDFNSALEINKRRPEIYNLRGEIYLLHKMFDQAIKDFSAAVLLNPMYSDAYLNRAKAYAQKGMKEEAESDYKQAITAEPDRFSGFVDQNISEELLETEGFSRREKTAEFFKQGLRELGDNKYSEAVESFSQAINLSPREAEGYVNRAQAYIKLGQADEAMVDLNRAAVLDPLNPTLYYWRAMAWKILNSPINMVADLKNSCELGYEPACIAYQRHKPQKH